jgi:hypothetical protein
MPQGMCRLLEHTYFKIKYLPKYTFPLIQLLNEGIIATCKNCYTHCTFFGILDASD